MHNKNIDINNKTGSPKLNLLFIFLVVFLVVSHLQKLFYTFV
nr:MAG TPA: hypothetical protein [Caudoviricetes sp.]